MSEFKLDRILELFFRGLKGEALSIQKLSNQYNVSTRSISRDISRLKIFLADHRELLNNAELIYSNKDRCYHLVLNEFLSTKELFALIKVLIGCKALNYYELTNLINKLKEHTSSSERQKLESLIKKELYSYKSIYFDCHSILDNLWELSTYIESKQLITIQYYKKNRKQVCKKLIPLSIIFSEYYYYLIAYETDDEKFTPKHFRIDRIISIIGHNENFQLPTNKIFDEGSLRQRCQFMWPGELQKIKFEFSGPSVQAILDRIPTAKIIDKRDNTFIIEAEVFGNGIRMFLLSQGAWVKILAPESFITEMKEEITKLYNYYQ